jgi:transposase
VPRSKERDGRMVTETIPNVKSDTLREVVLRNVEKGSAVSTDELVSYNLLKKEGYDHRRVTHAKKNSIRSTHIHVSQKYMQRYLDEFTFRSNHHQMQNAMFNLLVACV